MILVVYLMEGPISKGIARPFVKRAGTADG